MIFHSGFKEFKNLSMIFGQLKSSYSPFGGVLNLLLSVPRFLYTWRTQSTSREFFLGQELAKELVLQSCKTSSAASPGLWMEDAYGLLVGSDLLSDDRRLMLYALHQQAERGKCTDPKPWSWNVVESAKWTSWSQLGDMPAVEAMRLYVKFLETEIQVIVTL